MKIDELFDVKDKVALVTGGSRGIGEMIAAAFLSNGVKVYISARKADPCDQKAIELSEKYGSECISIPADVGSMDGIIKLTEEIKAREDKLDFLINNAGAAWGDAWLCLTRRRSASKSHHPPDAPSPHEQHALGSDQMSGGSKHDAEKYVPEQWVASH